MATSSSLDKLKALLEKKPEVEIEDYGSSIVAHNVPEDVDPYEQLEYCDNVESEGPNSFRFEGVHKATKAKLISILKGK